MRSVWTHLGYQSWRPPEFVALSDLKGVMCCLRCRGRLVPTGQEPYRFECERCKQQYNAVFQLVPVDSKPEPLLEQHVKRSTGAD